MKNMRRALALTNKPPALSAWLAFVVLVNAASILYYIGFFSANGYLPSPFLYDKSDTFMDLFNTLHWAYDGGRYTDWASVYPPLNFILLRIINFVSGGAEYGSPSHMREHSPYAIAGLGLIYLMVPAIVLKMKCWRDFQGLEKLLIYFAIIFSPPMLFALERGNLIFLAPLLLALALAHTGVLRSVYIAILVNLKAYLALTLVFYAARRDWKGLVVCAALSGSLFLVTGFFLDEHFFQFFSNILNFSHREGIFSLREMMAMPSSISAFSYVLKTPSAIALASQHASPVLISIAASAIEIVKWISLAAALVILLKRITVMRDAEIFAVLLVLISNLGVWVGGYTMILYIALIPTLMNLSTKRLSISLLVLMALPFDLVPIMRESIGAQYSYLSDSTVSVNWTLGLGSVIRPVANLMLLWLLSYEFLTRRHARESENIALHGH